jgi:hypothetical protein
MLANLRGPSIRPAKKEAPSLGVRGAEYRQKLFYHHAANTERGEHSAGPALAL